MQLSSLPKQHCVLMLRWYLLFISLLKGLGLLKRSYMLRPLCKHALFPFHLYCRDYARFHVTTVCSSCIEWIQTVSYHSLNIKYILKKLYRCAVSYANEFFITTYCIVQSTEYTYSIWSRPLRNYYKMWTHRMLSIISNVKK